MKSQAAISLAQDRHRIDVQPVSQERSRRRPGNRSRTWGRPTRRGRPGSGEGRPAPLHRRAGYEDRAGRAVVGAVVGVLLESPAELGEDQDQHPLVELARPQPCEELAQRPGQRPQQLLVRVKLARVGIETLLGRVEDAERRVGLDQPADDVEPALERLGSGGGFRRNPIQPRGQVAGRRVAEPHLVDERIEALVSERPTASWRRRVSRKSAMLDSDCATVFLPVTARGMVP